MPRDSKQSEERGPYKRKTKEARPLCDHRSSGILAKQKGSGPIWGVLRICAEGQASHSDKDVQHSG